MSASGPPDDLEAQTRAFNVELERMLASIPPVYTVPAATTRELRRRGGGVFPAPVYLERARTLEIDGPSGTIPLRMLAPRSGEGVGALLHIHGGGWTLGESDGQDPQLQRIADDTGLSVISVGYRLAPEHPYPAGPDDCEAAALWLLRSEAAAGLRNGPLAIGGDSAGAHLSAVTLLRLRNRHEITDAFGAAVLQYGAFDLSKTPSARRWGQRNLVLSEPTVDWFLENFLPGIDRESRREPDISPLYADLSGMPPAVFTIGTEDMLLDDTLFMEARWRLAGADTELHIWPSAPHGFLSLPAPVAEYAFAAEHAFLRTTLGL